MVSFHAVVGCGFLHFTHPFLFCYIEIYLNTLSVVWLGYKQVIHGLVDRLMEIVGVPVVEFDENTQSYSDNGYYITPSQVRCSSHTILACCSAERLRTRLKLRLSRASYILKIIALGV